MLRIVKPAIKFIKAAEVAKSLIYIKDFRLGLLLKVLEEEQYTVSGGWFDKTYSSSVTTTINGCTWGSSIIKSDIVAACGLHLEFGNKVVTSRINKIFHISSVRDN